MKTQILNFSLCIIEQLIFYIFFNTTFQKRFKSYIPVTAAILLMSVISFCCSNVNVLLKTAICIFLLTLSCHILYKDKIYIHTAFVLTILYIISIVDIIFGNLFSLIFSAQFLDVFYSRFSYRLVVCLIAKAINIILVLTLHRFFSRFGLDLKRYVWMLYNVVMAVFLFVSMSFIYLYMNTERNSESSVFFMIISLSFLIMNFIVIYFFTKICSNFSNEKKLYLLESNYAALRDNMAFQNSSSEKIKKSRHDMKSHIMTVKTLLENENVSEAEQLLNELEKQIDSIKIELSESTGNPLIDAVILQNAAICESKHIGFSYDLTVLPNMNISEADLSSVLSNLLNNAVEAAEKTENPFIELSVSVYKSFLSIAIKNSYCHEVTISENRLISSKEDKDSHGYGTQIISDIAAKYDGDFSFEPHTTFFLTSVLLNMFHFSMS